MCGPGEFWQRGPNACADCAAGSHRKEAKHSIESCAPHTPCTAGEWETAKPTATSNRECKTHTTCAQEQYEVKSAQATSDRACAGLETCPPGTYVFAGPDVSTYQTATSDRVCKRCADGTYSSYANWGECRKKSWCGMDEYAEEDEPTADVVCRRCPRGEFTAREGSEGRRHREPKCLDSTSSSTTSVPTTTTTTTTTTSTTSTTPSTSSRTTSTMRRAAAAAPGCEGGPEGPMGRHSDRVASYTCRNNECIPLAYKCDGGRDCRDGSDEVGCDGRAGYNADDDGDRQAKTKAVKAAKAADKGATKGYNTDDDDDDDDDRAGMGLERYNTKQGGNYT